LGVFAQENIDLIPKTLILTAGLRHDHAKLTYVDRVAPSNSGSQEFQRANPRVGLNWNPAPFFGAYALYSEAFRTPTVSEITALGPFSQSPLRPVKARNWELGAHAELPKDVRVRAAAFLEDARDDIYAVFDPTAGFGQNVNIDKTRRWGVEWSAKAKLAEPADVEVKHTFTRATFGSSFVLDKVPFGSTQQVKKGDRIPMVPQHRVSATLTVRPAQGWRTSLDGTCVSSQHLFGDEANQEPQLPAYCTVNLGLAYERGGWSAFVNGYNMLDSRYNVRGILSTNPTTFQADRFLIPAPGINFFGGVSYRFSARK
jgi:iron complex outermembrane receptor protein